jgi:hypothetical protein
VVAGPPGEDDDEPFEWFSSHPYEHHISSTNLAPILFQLEPGPNQFAGVKVPRLADLAGNVVVTDEGRELRFFSFLPRYIPYDISGVLLEFWFRLDPRLEPSDILDRMAISTKAKRKPKSNALNNRRARLRALINARSWFPGRKNPCENEVELLENLSMAQILYNTSMIVSGGTLRVPRLQDNKIVDYIDSTLPLSHFLLSGPINAPSHRMLHTAGLRRRLQALALLKGHGNESDNWTRLGFADLPGWWHDRNSKTNAQREEEGH